MRTLRASTAYDAKGGLLGAGIELGARYLFNERWGVEGAASCEPAASTTPPIRRSPQQGSPTSTASALGITRRISLDF